MEGTLVAIQHFIDDVFEYKRLASYERTTEDSWFKLLDPKWQDGYPLEYVNRRCDEASQKNWDAKGPAIDARERLLKSGSELAPHLVPHPEVAKKLHAFLYHMDDRVMRLTKGMEIWPDLAIELNGLRESVSAAVGQQGNSAASVVVVTKSQLRKAYDDCGERTLAGWIKAGTVPLAKPAARNAKKVHVDLKTLRTNVASKLTKILRLDTRADATH